MTIDEAINYKEHYLENNSPFMSAEAEAADRLGLEALKRIKDYRKRSSTFATPLLPGETEE